MHKHGNPATMYRHVATQTATPAQLVLMLYDGAIKFLERAMLGFDLEDPLEHTQTVHNNVQRAQAIIAELNAVLNMEAGGEFSQTMRRLYEYFTWRLDESNRHKQPAGIQEIIARLTVLRDAWAEMSKQTPAQTAAPVLVEH